MPVAEALLASALHEAMARRHTKHGSGARRPTSDKRVRVESSPVPIERIWRRVLARRLKTRLSARVSLAVTDNRHTMLSFKRRGGEYRVRLHHMFLAAPDPVVGALAAYLREQDPAASASLDRFIAAHKVYIRRVPAEQLRRRVPIEPWGAAHDLQAIFDGLNRRHFRNQVDASITYSRVPRIRRARKSIKLGSYSAESKLIRVHPALDQPRIPRYFVEWIVFHEMLHHQSPATVREGKRCVHTPEFNAREQAFPGYQRAKAWERKHLDMLLRHRPRNGHP